MSDQFVAEIRIFGFNFAPIGWALCAGQLMAISQNTALFSLLGTQFGGDGKVTFGLPNLQGNAALDQGQGPGLSPRSLGETGGVTTVTLTTSEMASHNHAAQCNPANGNDYGPANDVWATDAGGGNLYAPASAGLMNAGILTVAGRGEPHPNLQPYLVMNYCIALQGIYPPHS